MRRNFRSLLQQFVAAGDLNGSSRDEATKPFSRTFTHFDCFAESGLAFLGCRQDRQDRRCVVSSVYLPESMQKLYLQRREEAEARPRRLGVLN